MSILINPNFTTFGMDITRVAIEMSSDFGCQQSEYNAYTTI